MGYTVTDQLRIALAQLNPKVGDLSGNLALARQALSDAAAAKAAAHALVAGTGVTLAEIVAQGYDPAERIERLIDIAEYKRRQSAPGPKLTTKAFGLRRRYPITNGYKDRMLG